jgi:hypothetical protein
MSLAHSILQMKNKDNVFLLKEKAKDIYEKLSLLAFVEEYVNATPNLKQTKEEVLAIVDTAIALQESKEQVQMAEEEAKIVVHQLEGVKEKEIIEDIKIETKLEEIVEQPFDELEGLMFSIDTPSEDIKNDTKELGAQKTTTLEEELQDTISVDEMASLFDTPSPKSLNDKLTENIKIGLNDRIAFVKNLFEGNQEDFNRVISQLNTYTSEKDAKKFINKMVKPEYNWSEQEELETRFIEIVERKFA